MGNSPFASLAPTEFQRNHLFFLVVTLRMHRVCHKHTCKLTYQLCSVVGLTHNIAWVTKLKTTLWVILTFQHIIKEFDFDASKKDWKWSTIRNLHSLNKTLHAGQKKCWKCQRFTDMVPYANILLCLVRGHFLAILAKESLLKKGQKLLGFLRIS